jgi:STE24 endopeptidase
VYNGSMANRFESTQPEVKHYQRLKHYALFATLALNVVGLVVAALLVGPAADRAMASWVGDNRWLRLIALGLVYAVALELLTLPVEYWSGFVLEHRFGLSTQSLRAWLWKRVKGWLLAGPLVIGLLCGLYALLWSAGPWWWLWAAAGWLALSVVLGQLVPVLILPLFYRVTPLDDPGLLDRFRRLAAGTGLTVAGVYRLGLSDETRKANAALAGLGRTRRVLLGDTLLDGFTPEEVEVVFAHELGHHVHRHLPKLIAVEVVLTSLSLWLADRVLHAAAPALGYAGPTDPGALPLLLLVLSAFALLVMPVQNALSRRFERQCDRYALQRTANPAAYRSAFTKLAEVNKSDPDPHPLVVWLFHDHPPIGERVALAGPLV